MGSRLAEFLWLLPDRLGNIGWIVLRAWFHSTRSFPLRDSNGAFRMVRRAPTSAAPEGK